MPTVNFIEIPLSEVPESLAYDGDKDHERHKFHVVEPVKVVGRPDPETLVRDLRLMLRVAHPFARELESVKAGHGWVISFAPGSNPSDALLDKCEQTIVRIVGCRQYARSRHRGLNGQLDIHFFHPRLDLDCPLVPYRNRHVNLLGRVRAAIDKLTEDENAKLTTKGLPTILSPTQVQRERRKSSGKLDLEEVIASITPETGSTWVAALKKILASHGITTWEIDLRQRLVIHRPQGRRKKKKRPLIFDLSPHLNRDQQLALTVIPIKDREKRNTHVRETLS